MATKTEKVAENVTGPFYVDSTCIDCDACRECAPEHFRREDDKGYSIVYNQPKTDEERARCVEALEHCPVEAIGQDGDA